MKDSIPPEPIPSSMVKEKKDMAFIASKRQPTTTQAQQRSSEYLQYPSNMSQTNSYSREMDIAKVSSESMTSQKLAQSPPTTTTTNAKIITPPPPQPIPSTTAIELSSTNSYFSSGHEASINHMKTPPRDISKESISHTDSKSREESEKSFSRQNSTVSSETIEVGRIETRIEKSEPVATYVMEESLMAEHKIEKVNNNVFEDHIEKEQLETPVVQKFEETQLKTPVQLEEPSIDDTENGKLALIFDKLKEEVSLVGWV